MFVSKFEKYLLVFSVFIFNLYKVELKCSCRLQVDILNERNLHGNEAASSSSAELVLCCIVLLFLPLLSPSLIFNPSLPDEKD